MSLRFGPPVPGGPNPGHGLVDFGSPAALDDVVFVGGGTIAGWVYFTSDGDDLSFAGGAATLWGKTNNTSGFFGWWLFRDGADAALQLRYDFSAQQGRWVSDDNTLLLDTWYHVAVVYDADDSDNDPQFYIDGVAVTTTQTLTPVGSRESDAAKRLILGEMSGQITTRGFEGYMRDMRIYTTELDAEAIAAIANGHGIDATQWDDILMALPLDDDSHRRAADAVSRKCLSENNGNELTITVDLPDGEEDGDQLLMVLASSGRTSVGDVPEVMTTPAGWTHVNIGQTDLIGDGSVPSVWVYRRTASGEPASYVVTGDQASQKAALIIAFRQPGFATVPDGSSIIITGTNSSPTCPSIIPSADALAIFIAVADDDDIEIGGDLRNYPEDVNCHMDYNGGAGGSTNNAMTLVIATQLVDGGVGTGTRLFPLTASEEWGCLSLAFLFGQGLRTEGSVIDVSDNAFPNRMLTHEHLGPDDGSGVFFDEENPDIQSRRNA